MWRLRFVIALAGLAALAGCGASDKLPDEDLVSAAKAPPGFKAIAACGTSIGRAYFQEPTDGEAWEDDRVSGGRHLFLRDPGGVLHVMFRGSTGPWTDAAEDGGKVAEVFADESGRTLQASVTYGASGVMETFSVHPTPDGRRWLLWTSNKTQAGGVITKVGAYRAKCA